MARFLRRNHGTALPGSIVFVDTETAPSGQPEYETRKLQKLLMGCATYVRLEKGLPTRRKQTVFTTADEFWTWLIEVSQPGRLTWVFAHNIGFDLTVLGFWEMLHSGKWRIRDDDFPAIVAERKARGLKPRRGFYVDSDPPVIISVTHSTGIRVVFVDTMNYWATSLKKLGKSIGLSKLSMPANGSDDATLTEYCRRDVDIIEKAILGLIKWVEENNYGNFKFTAASQAMAAFRHRFYHKAIVLDRPDPVVRLERAGYFGARIEMLYEGPYDAPVWELDVQAMFPTIMRDEMVPRELVNSWLDGEYFMPPPNGPGVFSLAEVLIETSTATYPLRTVNATIYPHGRYWTVLCGRELQAAFERGHVSVVGRWAHYRTANLFRDFVLHFWDKRMAARRAGNDLEDQLCKTIPAALYGKWGQLSPRWEPFAENREGPRWGQVYNVDGPTGKRTLIRYIGRYVEKQVEPHEHAMAFPAISAWITAAARQFMRRLVAIAGPRNTLYVVYDALFVNKLGYLNLLHAGEVKQNTMGKLKVKHYGESATFNGFNNYTIGDRRVLSGCKDPNESIVGDQYSQTEFQGIREIVSSRPLPGVLTEEKIIAVPRPRRRWNVQPDNYTLPLVVEAASPAHLQAIRDKCYLEIEQL